MKEINEKEIELAQQSIDKLLALADLAFNMPNIKDARSLRAQMETSTYGIQRFNGGLYNDALDLINCACEQNGIGYRHAVSNLESGIDFAISSAKIMAQSQ